MKPLILMVHGDWNSQDMMGELLLEKYPGIVQTIKSSAREIIRIAASHPSAWLIVVTQDYKYLNHAVRRLRAMGYEVGRARTTPHAYTWKYVDGVGYERRLNGVPAPRGVIYAEARQQPDHIGEIDDPEIPF